MGQESIIHWLTHAGPYFPQGATWEHARNILQTYFRNITSLSAISSFVSSSLKDPSQLITLYKETDPLESSLYFSSALTIVHYIMSEITKNYSQVDKAWSILPGLYAWHYTIHDYLLNGSFRPRLLVGAILISIWGARLTYNFARKGGYYFNGQDYRYPYLRERLGPVGMALLNLVFIAPFQNLLLLYIVTPLYITHSLFSNASVRTTAGLSTLDWITVILHLGLLFIEVVADEQQYVFQTEKYALLSHLNKDQLKGDYKLGFLWHSGLFQYSRHPNFFAEQSMWWVIYLFSVAAVQEASGMSDLSTYLNWTIAAPIVLTALFQGSTALTEVSYSSRLSYHANAERIPLHLVENLQREVSCLRRVLQICQQILALDFQKCPNS
ncbi:DUF1295 domain protein [Mucor ambiguus]|uniref:DUF1295 domain protein n=1 Tax=Mucor ambiguus TaxID=91626 RepID=A0A0C9MST3_9FUNG|nr:DUF1295 domain protein [Mucor ambiguus]